MAEEIILDQAEEKKRIKEERKKLKAEQKAQKKEARQRAKELSYQEADLEQEGSNLPIFFTTVAIVCIWLAILCVLIKLDVGGFGSNVLTPVLKDVPVVNKILPGTKTTGESVSDSGEGSYSGYNSLKEAVEQIKVLELQLQQADMKAGALEEENKELQDEIARLRTFEESQVEFERIKTQFYEEVIYADNGPGVEEYQKYYESIDPTTAEFLYKQVVGQLEESKEVQDYAQAYSSMKPKQAAGIFEEMTNNLDLAARILKEMDPEARGDILGVMDSEIAAKLTKIMEPDS
ncbi:MAG: MotE family protein [Lachnospiraceae bacterium]